MRNRRTLALTLAAVLSLALAAGCSDNGENGGGDEPQANPWPLTGLDGYPEGDTRQAITVKIENTEAGRPQVGIDSADIVYEELVEGGLTRLGVMFHSKFPTEAEPVRSMRETDIGLVKPTGGTLAASGGSGSTLAAFQAAGVPTAVEGDAGFSRDSSRRSPYNVSLDVSALAASLPPNAPPAPYFTFGEVPEALAGQAVSGIDLRWPASSTAFTYDATLGQWTRSDLDDPTGFSFTNVVVLKLRVSYSGTDAAGTPIPTMQTTGSGSGQIATGGEVYDVTWSKASDSAAWQFSYTDEGESKTFPVPPGRTWLALLPADGGTATYTPAATTSPSPQG